VENALGGPRSSSRPPPASPPSGSRSQTIAKNNEFENSARIETLALAKKTNAPRLAVVATNQPIPEATEPPLTPAPDEWTPALGAYVAPKDPNNLWPILLIALLIALTTELMRRHRRRRKVRYSAPWDPKPSR
jgi:hypothetical protein